MPITEQKTTVKVAGVFFRNGETQKCIGYIDFRIAEGVAMFVWDEETVIFPLDTIDRIVSRVEEE